MSSPSATEGGVNGTLFDHTQIPADLVAPVRRVQRRVRTVTLLKGLAVVLGVFLMAALVAMGVDLLRPIYNDHVRLAIVGAIFAAALALGGWRIIRRPYAC